MPELPDVLLYLTHLERLLVGRPIEKIRVLSPNVLQTVRPSPQEGAGRTVIAVSRIGKRIVWQFETVDGDDLFFVFHPMVAGRFHLKKKGAAVPRKNVHAVFELPDAVLLFTEASTRKRATLHVVGSAAELKDFDRGGLDVMKAGVSKFAARLRQENHTLKRSLSDPTLFDGVGNTYSDEILFAAKLSPLKLTRRLTDEEIFRLHAATQATLQLWIDKLQKESKNKFPEKVTAFRPDMAVHGKFGQPCPVCGSPVQRISYAENECNYCARCQTGGKLLADRGMSRLLKKDWPKTLDDLEETRPELAMRAARVGTRARRK